jgi:hypothetical protein
MFLNVWKYLQMHQNAFLTSPDVKKQGFKKHVSIGLCIKTRFLPLQMVNKIFFKNMFLMVRKYAHMHQNAFLLHLRILPDH